MDVAASIDPSDRLRAGAELAIVLGLLEAELWSLRGWAPAWFNVAVYAILGGTVVASIHRRRGRIEPAAATSSSSRAWVEATAACAILSTILLVVAGLIGDRNETYEFVFLQKPPLKLLNWLLGKFGAALGQQLALQWFLWPLCREVAGSRTAGMALAASLFGFVHLPSLTLVAITLLAGLVWVGLYRRSGRLAPLVASHMVLATLAHGALPERLTYDMRVGMTATADQSRFTALEDPRVRQINRRLKENRDDLRHYSSAAYYEAQGGTDPAFIRALFRDLLQRPAGEADVKFWQDQHFARIREQVPSIFLASDEYANLQAARRAEGKPAPVRR